MQQNLIKYHQIPPEKIAITGWTQHDLYFAEDTFLSAEKFISSLGLDPSRPFIFFAANAHQLGRHEPSIMKHIVEKFMLDDSEISPTLLIRTHPHDPQSIKQFPQPIPGRLSLEQGRFDDLKHVANLLKHAVVTINTCGTVAIDAVTLGNRTICIDFDGDLNTPAIESIKWHNKVEHIEVLRDCGVVDFVANYDELDAAIKNSIGEPIPFAEGKMNHFIDKLTSPFDGHAVDRHVDQIVRLINQEEAGIK